MELLEQLKKYFDSEEGKEYINKVHNQARFNMSHYDKYSDKLYSLTKEDRNSLFEKVKHKYDSDEYYNRWMKRGIMPPKDLYNYLYEYGLRYGFSVDELNIFDPWLDDGFIIDDWIIIMVIGQGTEFVFMKVDDYKEYQNKLKDKYDKQ